MRLYFKTLNKVYQKFGDFDIQVNSEERDDMFFSFRDHFFTLRFHYYIQIPDITKLVEVLPNGYIVKETEYECDERGSLYEYEVRWS